MFHCFFCFSSSKIWSVRVICACKSPKFQSNHSILKLSFKRISMYYERTMSERVAFPQLALTHNIHVTEIAIDFPFNFPLSSMFLYTWCYEDIDLFVVKRESAQQHITLLTFLIRVQVVRCFFSWRFTRGTV